MNAQATRLATLDDMHEAYSDLYKSVHGIRPRWVSFSTIEEAGEAMLRLEDEADLQIADMEKMESNAAIAVEEHIKFLIATGAGDRATAIRWMHQAERTNGDNESLCYKLGLKFGYFNGEKK